MFRGSKTDDGRSQRQVNRFGYDMPRWNIGLTGLDGTATNAVEVRRTLDRHGCNRLDRQVHAAGAGTRLAAPVGRFCLLVLLARSSPRRRSHKRTDDQGGGECEIDNPREQGP